LACSSTQCATPHGTTAPVQASSEATSTKHDASSGWHGKAAATSRWYVCTAYVDATPTPTTTKWWNAPAPHVHATTAASTFWLNTNRGRYHPVGAYARQDVVLWYIAM